MSRIGFVLLFASLWLGCGKAPIPKCDFQTCNGCCDAAGECQSGAAPNACGTSGSSCQACTNSVCQLGVCSFVNTSGGGSGGGTGGGATGGGAGGGTTGGGSGGGTTGGGTGGGTTGGGSGGGTTGGGTGGGTTGGGTGGGTTGGGTGGGTTGGGTGGGGTTQPGDTCNNPTSLTFDSTGVATFNGDNAPYANDGQGTCGDSRDRIFSFSLSTPTWVEISGSGLLAYHVRTTCMNASSELWCSASTGRQLLQAGTHYVWAEASGVYSLRVQLLPGETCETAVPILSNSMTATVQGTLDSYTPHVQGTTCVTAGTGPDRAYSFVTTGPQSFTASLSQVSGFSPRLVLQSLTPDCSSVTQEGCEAGTTASLSLRRGNLPAGRYVLWVKGTASGTFTLTTTLGTAQLGETCSDPIPLVFSGNSATVSGDTTSFFPDSTSTGTATCSSNGTGNDVVYAFTQTANGTLTVNVAASGGSLRPVVYVRSATSCATTSNDLSCGQATAGGGTASFTASLAAGSYYLVVDGFATPGTYTLTATQAAMSATAADTCAGATIPLISSAGTVTVLGNNTLLNPDYTSGTAGTCNGNGSGNDGVFLINHPTTGAFTATVSAATSSAYRPIMYLRTTCTSSTSDISCFPNAPSDCSLLTGTLSVSSLAAGTYFLIVDSCGTNGLGAFNVTVTQ